MHKDWYNLDNVPYCFLSSSSKFIGHMGWKICDLNQVWVRLLGWSQLSNPSDLPCLFSCKMSRQNQLGNHTGDPLHSRALAHSRAPLFTQPCPHCSHSRAPGEQWARLCVFTLQGCVQAARLCRGSPVHLVLLCHFCEAPFLLVKHTVTWISWNWHGYIVVDFIVRTPNPRNSKV